MKVRLVTFICMMVFSFAAFAGGAGCKSKDGHEMHGQSADAKAFKDNHSWLFSESEANDVVIPGHEQLKESGQSNKSAKDDLVEI